MDRRFTKDFYFDDNEHEAIMAAISGPLAPADPAPAGDGVTRAELAEYMAQITGLITHLIQSIKPADITISPRVVAEIQPHKEVKTISRDSQNRITGVTSEIQ